MESAESQRRPHRDLPGRSFELLPFFRFDQKTDIPTGVSVAVDGRMIAMLVIETVRWSSCF
jgi:hypothetical protein